MALKLRAGAATIKTDSFRQVWPPRPDSFKRGLGGAFFMDLAYHTFPALTAQPLQMAHTAVFILDRVS